METRVAAVSIIVENPDSVEKLNAFLHEAGQYIIGRMGVPYREKNISIVLIVISRLSLSSTTWLSRMAIGR